MSCTVAYQRLISWVFIGTASSSALHYVRSLLLPTHPCSHFLQSTKADITMFCRCVYCRFEKLLLREVTPNVTILLWLEAYPPMWPRDRIFTYLGTYFLCFLDACIWHPITTVFFPSTCLILLCSGPLSFERCSQKSADFSRQCFYQRDTIASSWLIARISLQDNVSWTSSRESLLETRPLFCLFIV